MTTATNISITITTTAAATTTTTTTTTTTVAECENEEKAEGCFGRICVAGASDLAGAGPASGQASQVTLPPGPKSVWAQARARGGDGIPPAGAE